MEGCTAGAYVSGVGGGCNQIAFRPACCNVALTRLPGSSVFDGRQFSMHGLRLHLCRYGCRIEPINDYCRRAAIEYSCRLFPGPMAGINFVASRLAAATRVGETTPANGSDALPI